MVDLRRIAPRADVVDAETLVEELLTAQRDLGLFDERVVDFIADLSRRLRRSRSVIESPALAALAFWIRPATVRRLHDDWNRLVAIDPTVHRVPRGVIFHLPPTNVDTLFVYSWLLSALTGNGNIVRLSESAVEGAAALLDIVGETLIEHPAVEDTTALVTYGHDREITSALSTADVRVIWGGDETVRTIRAIPTGPATRDLAFPDRYSFSVLGADVVAHCDDAEISDLAHRFFNDAYWFDQLGCASPRLVVWHGDAEVVSHASKRFRSALSAEIDKQQHPATPTSAALAKLVHASDMAARGAVTTIDWCHNSLTTVGLDSLDSLERDSPGGGLFYEIGVTRLAELLPFIRRKDQTVTTFGIDYRELREFVSDVGARGVDRVVEVGNALTFGRYWDGIDLLVEFTRSVHIDVAGTS